MGIQIESFQYLLDRLLSEIEVAKPLLPTYVHLILSAIFPIYTAAHASLARPSSAKSAEKRQDTADDDEDGGDEREIEEISSKIETLTPSDALLFPIMAGCTLAALYFILKFLQDPAWLNWFLGLYFACIGFFFMMRFLKDGCSVVRSLLLPRKYSLKGHVWVAGNDQHRFTARDTAGKEIHNNSPFPGLLRSVPLPSKLKIAVWNLRRFIYAKAKLEFSLYGLIGLKGPLEALDVVSLALTSLIVGYHTFIDKPWYLTNILGFSFSYGSLQFITPGTSWTGTLLLSALFFYDIYFVFFTPMMVTVATKLDVPIKLLFPRPDGCILPVGAEDSSEAMEEYLKCIAKKRTMAMLGLGDIVIPGMMLAFALRFDLYKFYLCKTAKDSNQEARDETKHTKSKPTYLPATGAWGERFWVSQKFQAQVFGGKRFPKTYFYATVAGYVTGMLTTVLIMQIFNHAQPALLYLVPGVLISLWGTALVKGDVKTLWDYSEMPVDEISKEETTIESKGESKHLESPEAVAGRQSGKDQDKKLAKGSAAESKDVTEDIGPKGHLIYLAIILPKKGKARTGSDQLRPVEETAQPDQQQISVD